MNFERDIEMALQALKQGGLILYPTDTIWGIGCDATNADAVQKIFKLKQRPESKGMIVLLADDRDILKYVAAPDPAVFEFLENVRKPTTVIFENAIGLADNLVAEDGSIGIRVVKDEFCRHLLKRFRKPIVSTSANISGMRAPTTFAEIEEAIKKGVDYVVEHRRSETSPATASAIVRWQKGKPVTIRN